MLDHGAYLVPTLVAPHGVIRAAEAGAGIPEVAVTKARDVIEAHRDSFRRAVEAGVKVAMGTDAGVVPHGTNLDELQLMADGGMSPEDVLVATTRAAAELMGLSRTLGTIEPGKGADLVVVSGDPFDFSDLASRIERVYQEGVLVAGAAPEPVAAAVYGLGYGGRRGRPRRKPAEVAPGEAGRLPVPRRGRRRPLRRQGEVAAAARPLVLPEDDGRTPADPQPARAGRRRRGDRHRQRGRGAPPRAEPRQAPPAAVQRPAARRQVVPVHRGHGRGRVPARDVHARAAPAGRLVLRPVREREEGARDARRAQPGLPLPAVRGAEARAPQRHPVPRLPHRPLPRALRRLRLAGGLPRARSTA